MGANAGLLAARRAWLEKKGGVNFALPFFVMLAVAAAGAAVWVNFFGA